MNVCLREVDVIVMSITHDGDGGLILIVSEYHLIAVAAGLLRTELKN